MKNMVKLFGAIALVAVIGFSMAGCDTGGGGGGGGGSTTAVAQKVSYGGINENGDAYSLEITEKVSRAAYSAKTGDSYVLTLSPKSGGEKKTKTGTVNKVETSQIILNNTASVTITVKISGQGMTQISGSITWDGASTSVTIEVTLTPAKDDFLISNGVLIKYLGSGGNVTIPDIRKTARFT